MTTTFTWDIAAGLPVILDDGAQYVYGAAGLTAQVSGANTYYYLADGLGSTMNTVDASGTIVNGYTYDVYGVKTAASGSQVNEFDFAGQQTDPTGLQYLRARYYDPQTGGFLSREPMAAFPQWVGNPLAYAASDPARMSDPSGLWPGEKAFHKAIDIVMDAAAVPPYAAYYASYELLGVADSFSELYGPAEPVVDFALLDVTVLLTITELAGIGGDIGIDLLKDANGTGQGWADEGYRGSVCPDTLQNILPQSSCPEVYLPGVHGTPILNEKTGEVEGIDTHDSSRIDLRWPFS